MINVLTLVRYARLTRDPYTEQGRDCSSHTNQDAKAALELGRAVSRHLRRTITFLRIYGPLE